MVAHGGDADDIDRLVEVLDHLADDLELLVILLAEIGAVGADDVEQLGHDGGDAGKMAGSHFALELPAERDDVDRGLDPARIHVLDAGSEEDIDLALLQHGAVAGEVTRIFGEILVGAELQGIDEKRGHDHVVLRAGARDELHVTVMQVAHCGNEADGASGASRGSKRFAQARNR